MTRRYEEFADRHLAVTLRSGSEYMVRCMYHDDSTSSLQFNVESGLWICFTCGAKGNINTLLKDMGLRVAEESQDTADILKKLDLLRKGTQTALALPVLPESYLARYSFPSVYWGPCPSTRRPPGCTGHVGCKQHRWFTQQTIEAFDLGFDPLNGCAIIPVRNVHGGLIGVIKRYLDDDAPVRYKYIKGFKRSLHLFGSWLVEKDSSATTVVITEGALDAAMVWQAGFPAVAEYGSTISRPQIRLLRRIGVQHVILLYDNDKAGFKATRYAQGWHATKDRKARTWVEEYDPTTDLCRSFTVSVASYGGHPYGADPCSIGVKGIRSALHDAVLIA